MFFLNIIFVLMWKSLEIKYDDEDLVFVLDSCCSVLSLGIGRARDGLDYNTGGHRSYIMHNHSGYCKLEEL